MSETDEQKTCILDDNEMLMQVNHLMMINGQTVVFGYPICSDHYGSFDDDNHMTVAVIEHVLKANGIKYPLGSIEELLDACRKVGLIGGGQNAEGTETEEVGA